jgi:hypothetical protein
VLKHGTKGGNMVSNTVNALVDYIKKVIDHMEGKILATLPGYIIGETKAGVIFVSNGYVSWEITQDLVDILCDSQWGSEIPIWELFAVHKEIEKLLVEVSKMEIGTYERLFVEESIKDSLTKMPLKEVLLHFANPEFDIFDEECAEKYQIMSLYDFLKKKS